MEVLYSPLLGSWMAVILLLSLRIGPLLFSTPILSAGDLTASVKVLLILGLSTALSLGLKSALVGRDNFATVGSGALFQAAATELALGLTLAVAVHVAFSAFAVAGRLLDIQVGFGLSQVYDPSFNAAVPILTTAFNRIAVLVFFLVNGHHALIRAISFSLQQIPLGRMWSIDAALAPILKQVGGLLGLSISLAAPVVFCILMTELALAVIARNLPQMNMLAMGVPIKIVVGVIALSLWLLGIGNAMDRVYKGIYTTWDSVLSSAATETQSSVGAP